MRGAFRRSHSFTVLPSLYWLACWCARKRKFGLCRCSPHDEFARTRGGRYLQCCRSPLALAARFARKDGGARAHRSGPLRVPGWSNSSTPRLVSEAQPRVPPRTSVRASPRALLPPGGVPPMPGYGTLSLGGSLATAKAQSRHECPAHLPCRHLIETTARPLFPHPRQRTRSLPYHAISGMR
jgi:hypothetical protein